MIWKIDEYNFDNLVWKVKYFWDKKKAQVVLKLNRIQFNIFLINITEYCRFNIITFISYTLLWDVKYLYQKVLLKFPE